jgi:protein-disulfide isomerase
MDDSKKNLILGIAIGVAIISTIGFFSLLFQKSGGTLTNQELVNNVKPTDSGPDPTTSKVDIQVADSDHIRGDKNAKVTIVEFSDFQCPFCQRFHNTMKQVMETYPGKVRWVYKHFPLDSIHPYARKAAEASECASEQGKFWEYADKLYEKQREIKPENFETFAKEVGLNVSKFNDCLNSGKYASKVNADYQAGLKAGVRGTPGNFINGQSVPGAQPFENIKRIIDGLL